MDRDQPPSSWTVAAGSRHGSSSPTESDTPEMMDFDDVPESPTGHKRTHGEMAESENMSKLPPTPQTPEDSNQPIRSRLQENEKPVLKTRLMGPPPPPRQTSSDQNDLPPSAQAEAQTPDGSPLPRSAKVNKATQRKRAVHTKLRGEDETCHEEGDQSESNGMSNREKQSLPTVADDAAEQQHDSEANEDQDEDSEDDEEPEEVEDDASEDNEDLPGNPIEPFDWDALEENYHEVIRTKAAEETKLWQEYTRLCSYHAAWAGASTKHEADRALKRHKTQRYYVQRREQELEDRRQHYLKVTAAFEAALSMLT
ncbi:hypothetical protein MBLNU457_7745t1 [Dothideomycetes sp. NU457]